MAGIEAFPVFTVTVPGLSVAARRVRTDELMAGVRFSDGFFEQRGQIALAAREALNKSAAAFDESFAAAFSF